MFDTKKIDSLFEGENSFFESEVPVKNKRSERLLFIKIALPFLAAILIGLLLAFPYIKSAQKSIDFDITLPKKGELEKLHIEKTKFHITDKDNNVSTLTADNIDETEPQSKIVKLINPAGKIPLKNGAFADINSASGYFDQANNQITMIDDVFINYNNETNVKTKNAIFDFNTKKGQGSAPITASGIYGDLEAEAFEFDNQKEIYTLLKESKVKIKRQPSDIFIRANTAITLYKDISKIVAKGKASLKNEDNVINADVIIALFSQNGKQPEITSMEAYGNVCVTSPKGTACAVKGIYDPKKEFVEMYGKVVIEQDGNKIFGERAQTDLKTGISKIIADSYNSRVKGIFKKIKKLSSGGKNDAKNK